MIELPNGVYINPEYVTRVFPQPEAKIVGTEHAFKPSVQVELKTGSVIIASEHEDFEEAKSGAQKIAAMLTASKAISDD